jgi:uncharacterized membrane protein YcaP (DUF421 family)
LGAAPPVALLRGSKGEQPDVSTFGAMLFDSWAGLGRILIVGVLAYAALVVTLRISGKRTLTKLNAFDLVVTIALGSILASVVLSKDIALAEGVLALVLLVLLQYAITWTSVRLPWFNHAIKSEPTLLVHRGVFLDGAMRQQRVTREEVFAALRGEGVAAIENAAAVVLETDGSISVVTDPLGAHGGASVPGEITAIEDKSG